MLAVLKNGMKTPVTTMMTRYRRKVGATPKAAVSTPKATEETARVWALFRKPPHTAIRAPPRMPPALKATSLAVSRQTSSPKRRATNRGVRKAAGTIMNIKRA